MTKPNNLDSGKPWRRRLVSQPLKAYQSDVFRFQTFAFKWVNLFRYGAAVLCENSDTATRGGLDAVGLCTLNSFDPYPITYSLSNP
jgi:hypothetical protein